MVEVASRPARLTARPGQRAVAGLVESRADRAARSVFTSVLIPLFVISLAVPISIYAGPLRLSPYRILLIIFIVPCVIAWLTGSLGRIRMPDVLILLFSLWGILALSIHHGATSWETSGILFIETFGSYLLARMLIRSRGDFHAMVRVLFGLICLLLPFAAIESLTNSKLLLEALGSFSEVVNTIAPEQRLGLYRAQSVFEHPILFGVFCASGLGLVYYTMGHGQAIVGRVLRTGIVGAAAVCSFSAGAAAAIMAQVGLAAWDTITRALRKRWLLLVLLFIAAYIVVDILSNRSPIHVFISYLTFSPATGYWRLIIFEHGFAEVMRNPLLGIGLADWERPAWLLGGSMDNFWLVVAVRYGIPAFFLLAGAVFLIVRSLARLEFDDERIKACRAGLLVTIGGLVVAAGTVHYWNAIYVWFMFVLGCGAWMLDPKEASTRAPSAERKVRALGVGTPSQAEEAGAAPRWQQSRRGQVRVPRGSAGKAHGGN